MYYYFHFEDWDSEAEMLSNTAQGHRGSIRDGIRAQVCTVPCPLFRPQDHTYVSLNSLSFSLITSTLYNHYILKALQAATNVILDLHISDVNQQVPGNKILGHTLKSAVKSGLAGQQYKQRGWKALEPTKEKS